MNVIRNIQRLITQRIHDSTGCGYTVGWHITFNHIISRKLNLRHACRVNQFNPKNFQHPRTALCGNICVKPDIWYGKKQKGVGDRVYWRAGQTQWVLVEAAKGCLCLHILHKRFQKCQPARLYRLWKQRESNESPSFICSQGVGFNSEDGNVLSNKCQIILNKRHLKSSCF